MTPNATDMLRQYMKPCYMRRLLLLLLLLAGGAMNGAWADDVTIHVLLEANGSDADVVTKDIAVGASLGSPYDVERLYCTLSGYYSDRACTSSITTLPSSTTEVYALYSFDAEAMKTNKHIEFSSSYSEAKWMLLNMPRRSSGQLFRAYLDGTTWYMSAKKFSDEDVSPDNISTHFAFIGSPFRYRIVNRLLGESKDLTFLENNGSTSKVTFQDGSHNNWSIVEPNNGAAYYQLYYTGSEVTNNNRYGDSTEPLKTYHEHVSNNDMSAQLVETDFTFHLTTKIGSKNLEGHKINPTLSSPIEVPNALKRKYVTKYSLYSDAAKTQLLTEITVTDAGVHSTATTTYQDLVDNSINDVYVDYEYAFPFQISTGYADADANNKWYNLQMDGGSTQTPSANWVYKQSGYNVFLNNGSTNGIDDGQLFAFVGDPYEFRMLSKLAGGDDYMGIHNTFPSSYNDYNIWFGDNNNYSSPDYTTWETVDRIGTAYSAYGTNQFALRLSGTYSAPYFMYAEPQIRCRNNYHSNAVRFTVSAPPVAYNTKFVIVNNTGGESVWFKQLSGSLVVPSCIQSPLANNYRFYKTKEEAVGDLPANSITDIDDAPSDGAGGKIVYVRYNVNDGNKLISTHGAFNMFAAGESSNNMRLGVLDTGNSICKNYDQANYLHMRNVSWIWYFDGGDPYNVTLRNANDEVHFIGKASPVTDGSTVDVVDNESQQSHFAILYNNYTSSTNYSLLRLPESDGDKFMYVYAETNNATLKFGNDGKDDVQDLLTHDNRKNGTDTYRITFSQLGITYFVINRSNEIAIANVRSQSSGAMPELQDYLQSPLASNYRYFTDRACTNEITSTGLPSNQCMVYVTYDVPAEPALYLNKLIAYNFKFNNPGNSYDYIKDPNLSKKENRFTRVSGATSDDLLKDEFLWRLDGNDPYKVTIWSEKNPSLNVRAEYKSGGSRTVLGVTDGVSDFIDNDNKCPIDQFMILNGTISGAYIVSCARNFHFAKNNEIYYFYPNQSTDREVILQMRNDGPEYKSDLIIANPSKATVAFHIVDHNGRDAISATREWYLSEVLPSIAAPDGVIPSSIYSPYIDGETLTYYNSAENAFNCVDAFTKGKDGSLTKDGDDIYHIYVRYTTDLLIEKPLHFSSARGFEMKVNGEYVYDEDGTLQHTSSEEDKDEKNHLWNTIGNDPYAVQIRNVETPTRFFTHNTTEGTLTLGGDVANTYFIAMKRTSNFADMETEFMAATGENLSSTDYYSIGRLTNGSPTMLRSDSYPHDNAAIQIILTPAQFDVAYRVIDKQNKIVLEVPATEDFGLPEAWKSPLVSDYHYWIINRFNVSGDVYELMSGLTTADEASSIMESTDGYIYVTYDVITDDSDPKFIDLNPAVDYTERVSRTATDNTQVRNAAKFGTMYMLQFTSSDDYKLETDNSEDAVATASGTTVYPYTNGDGPIYIYPENKWESQRDGGASTRTRWPWYLLSPNNDPYHVMVTSWQNSHVNNGTNYYSFLRTFYNETLGSVVTNNVTDDPSTLDEDDNQILPTEYMLLKGNGTTGNYMLKTTEEINGTHEPVTSFEQYWRNNPTVQRTLGLAEGSGPISLAEKQTLRDAHGWHNYDYYANAAAWTETNPSNKSYAKEEHWFMTVNVGDGSFNIVPTEIDAVLVLLDNHGWEIMRQKIAKHSETTRYAATQAELRKYDSPMVSQYKFYGYRDVAHKVSGYHKYAVAETERVNPTEKYSSLADYPEKYSGDALYDLYVTYDVKSQYAEAYTGAATQAGTMVNKAFIIRQDGKLAKATDGTTLTTVDASTTGIDAGTTDGLDDEDLYWYLKPNFDIDEEMGYLYDVKDADNNVIDKATTNANYHANGQSGFDPYNIQIVNKAHVGYFTTDATGASMVNHGYLEGTYPSTNGTLSLGGEPSAQFSQVVSDYDSKTLHVTNATFMAVQDENGNMRLMPRFDHSRVITDFTAIEVQHAAQPEDDKADGQSTMLFLPIIYTYIIVDNSGREALRYTALSSGAPSTPLQYKSPLATSFRYYKTLTASGDDYDLSTLGGEITGSFADAEVSDDGTGTVYVRYDYNRDGDTQGLLQGMWLTMQLNSSNRQYSGGNVTTGSVDATQAAWQWRLLQKAADEPDPYSVNLYSAIDMAAPISINDKNRFAILRFNDATNAYALAVAGTKSTDTYTFVNGADATATTAAEADAFKNSGTITDANKVQFTADVNPTTITYRLITNLKHLVLTGDATAPANYVPSMPQWMRSPLMKDEEDTYQYYAGATVSGTEYTVLNPTETLRNLDIEDGKSVVYVRYDYETSKQAAAYNSADPNAVLNLDGSVPYRFALNTSQAVNVRYDQTVDVQTGGNKLLMHDARSLWYFTGNDPYEFKISNYYDKSTFISVKDVAVGTGSERQPAMMLADVDETYKFNTFMILKAPGEKSSEKALTCYVSGSQRIFLIELSNQLQVYKHNKDYSECYRDGDWISAGNNVLQKYFRFVPAMAYHVITNSGQEAIVAASDFTGFETVTIPNAIHTPLLNKSDFRYYTRISTDGSGTISVDPDSEIADGTSIYDHVANGEGDIYIRYTYNRGSSPRQYLDGYDKTTAQGLDLSGRTWYTMVNCGSLSSDNKPVYNYIIWANDGSDMAIRYNKVFDAAPSESELKTRDGWELRDKRLLWCLEGNDPYAIKIRNASKGKSVYVTGNSNSDYVYFVQEGNEANEEYATFMYLTIASKNDQYVAIEDMGATFVPTGHWNDDRCFNGYGGDNLRMFKWGENIFVSRLGSENFNNDGYSCNTWISFYKAPAGRKYHYHAYNQTTGKWTWDATLEHDFLTPVVLEDDIARLYCKYEANTIGTTLAVTGSNDFKTRAELEALDNAQFYRNEAMTERVYDESSNMYDTYPEIEENEIYDIYFKYQVDAEATDIDGKKLAEITSTPAQIAADKETFDKDGKLKKDNIEANWWFMVLDTDEDISATGSGSERTFTGKQYFLRREDDGGVDWLDNAFTLHKEPEDNYKNWTYSRLAETYRVGENDAFREPRWLWTFVGDDPYNMHVLNMESWVGVTPKAAGTIGDLDVQGVYSLKAAENCWTTISEKVVPVKDGSGRVTSVTSYPVGIPGSQPTKNDTWGLCAGSGTEKTFSLLSTAFTTKDGEVDRNLALYWTMTANDVTKNDSVGGAARTTDRTQAIQLLPYEPVRYENLRLVIRRNDKVDEYMTYLDGKGQKNPLTSYYGDQTILREHMQYIDNMTTGMVRMYSSEDERMFVKGDVIDVDNLKFLPIDVQRSFCNYTIYSDDYFNHDNFVVQYGAIRSAEPQRYPDDYGVTALRGQIIYNAEGMPMYNYYAVDPMTGEPIYVTDDEDNIVKDGEGNPVPQGAAPQTVYVMYEVTSDIFLREHPTKAEVATMAETNDHVYFMDFPDPQMLGGKLEGYDTGHHAYFHETATFEEQVGRLRENRTEKRKWDGKSVRR